jgi:lysozyme family protein
MLPKSVFDFIIMNPEIEGGSVMTNDPLDPGGLTKYGVSQKSFPSVDIANLTEDSALTIYDAHYWRRARCDELPPALALCMFDCAVNQGSVTAVKILQRALNVQPDGVFGPTTLNAVATRPLRRLVTDFIILRSNRYLSADDAAEERFEKGWIKRLFLVMSEASSLIVS